MKTMPFVLPLCLLLALCAAPVLANPAASGVRPPRPAILDQALQLLLVTAPDWKSVPATMQRYQRAGADAPWEALGAAIPVGLGKNGLARCEKIYGNALADKPVKREGDGKSPAGVFLLSHVFAYAPEQARTAMPVLPVTKDLVCVDDPDSRHYNLLVSQRTEEKDWNSAERMLRPDGLYRFGVLVAYNDAPVRPGAGSCIFLHLERGPQRRTTGCTAMPLPAMQELIGWLDPSRRPVLLQLPEGEYRRLRAAWRLP